MKIVVLALCLVVTAFAYPDVSELSGYNYNRPSGDGPGSVNEPSGSYIPASGSNNFGPATSAIVNQPSKNYIAAGSSNDFGHTISPGGSYIPPSSNSFGQMSPSGSYLPGGEHGSNAIQEQKHVYFYAAPDDEEKPRLRIQVAPSSHKNTKIIFVKAPSYGGVVPEVVAPPSQAEDKTLVYVLVKKPEQPGAVNIPAAVGVKQAKPEVYFIKYKNQQEAESAVSESLGEHPTGSNLPSLNDAQAFVRTLKDSFQKGSGYDGSISGGVLGGGASPVGSGGFGGPGGLLGTNDLGSSGLGGTGFGSTYGPPGKSGPY